jgi:hypothetical protein
MSFLGCIETNIKHITPPPSVSLRGMLPDKTDKKYGSNEWEGNGGGNAYSH